MTPTTIKDQYDVLGIGCCAVDELLVVPGSSTAGFFKAYEASGWKVPVSDISIAVPHSSESPCAACESPIENSPPGTATG